MGRGRLSGGRLGLGGGSSRLCSGGCGGAGCGGGCGGLRRLVTVSMVLLAHLACERTRTADTEAHLEAFTVVSVVFEHTGTQLTLVLTLSVVVPRIVMLALVGT